MKIKLIAVGTRMPDWVDEAVEEYARRLPGDFRLEVKPVPMARRGRNADVAKAMQQESDSLLGQIDNRDTVVVLDVEGRRHTTDSLARRMASQQHCGSDIALLVGGPDGLDAGCLQRADERWSLSDLTLPHPLVRVVLAEQIYRVWTVLQGHPYHRR
ncbi:MAG: 23S rRNA (pseudouridine(1915)-N(3))-methyltransferase RlmH [Pseudohongiellaceae bacterium]